MTIGWGPKQFAPRNTGMDAVLFENSMGSFFG